MVVVIEEQDEEMNVRVQGEAYTLEWWKKQVTAKRVFKVLVFFLYFIIGCLVYNHLEGWEIYETLCFSIVTMATVGYGYRHPTSEGSRLFTIFYLIFGVYMIYFLLAKELSKMFVSVIYAVRKRASNDVEAIGLGYAHQKRWIGILISITVVSAFISAGILKSMESNWSYIDCLYMVVQTIAVSVYLAKILYVEVKANGLLCCCLLDGWLRRLDGQQLQDPQFSGILHCVLNMFSSVHLQHILGVA
jgi:hypothetical protein